ncbi:MAG: hypothetical protein ABI390_08235 [Daejeonella sp.]
MNTSKENDNTGKSKTSPEGNTKMVDGLEQAKEIIEGAKDDAQIDSLKAKNVDEKNDEKKS